MPEFLLKIAPEFITKPETNFISAKPISSYSIKIVLKTEDKILDLGCVTPAKA